MRQESNPNGVALGRYLLRAQVDLKSANPGVRLIAANVTTRLANSGVCSPLVIDENLHPIDCTAAAQRPTGDLTSVAAHTTVVRLVDRSAYLLAIEQSLDTCANFFARSM